MKKLLCFFRGYGVQSVLAPLFKMLEAIFELLIPLVVARIIDVGIGENNKTVLFSSFAIMVALGVIGLTCAVCAQFFAAKTAVGFATALRSALFAHVQKFSYAKTDAQGTSTLITRMTADVNTVQTGINLFLRLFMRSPFIVFGAMIMAFTVSPRHALIFTVTIPALAVVVFGIMLISIPLYKKVQSALDRVVGKTRENCNGIRVIRAFNREEEEMADFEEKNRALTKIQLLAGRISALMNPLTYVIINSAILLLIHFGALSVDNGTLSRGELIALYNYMSQILVELIKLASLIITLTKSAAGAKRISAVLESEPCEERRAETATDAGDDAVVFDRVSFSYTATADPAISNVSFRVRRGQTVGIIGSTGCGKSTLVHLIPGFYAPTEGSVFVNGKNTALYDTAALRSMVGIVLQKPTLFRGSIRSNLLWGKADATEEELKNALELAQATEFVDQKGLDAPVEQNGRNFSGGQKQRLTIARALVRRPEILILDDAASALDYGTEAKLRASLKHLSYDPTVFIVSQRTSSIRHADLILVLEDGVVIDQGTHEELLERCTVYREIHHTQFPKEVGAHVE